MAAKNILAKLALGFYADTSELGPSLAKASSSVERETKKMGSALKYVDKEAQSMGKAFKYANALAKQQLSELGSSVTKLEKETTLLTKSVGGLSSSMKGLGVAAAGAIGAGSISQALKMADTYNTLNQRIKIATLSTKDYVAVSDQLAKISAKNGASLADTVKLFQNIARTRTELGVTNKEILTLTNTIQQLGVIGGSSTEEMGMALRQFSQSMAGGIVRAEEFNSIVENMPELADRIARGLGVTQGQLRKLMLDGKLLSKDVVSVLLKQSEEIDKQFSAMPRSMAMAFQALTDKTGLALAKIDQVTGATKLAVKAIDEMASSVEKLGKALANIGEDSFASKDGPIKLKNIFQAGANQGFGLNEAKDQLAAIGGFLDPTKDPRNVRSQLNLKRRMRETQEWADLHGLNDPAFKDLEKRLDDWKAGKPDTTGGEPARRAPAAVDEKEAAKAKKKHDAELKHADQILANMRSQNEQLRAKLAHDDEALTKEKAILQVSKDKTLTDKEKKKYAEEINKLAAEHAAIVKQTKIAEEKEKLKEILNQLKEKTVELKNQLAGQKELNTLARAEADIQKTVKEGKKETAQEQKAILAAAKEAANLEKQIQRQKIEKAIKEDDLQLGDKLAKEKDAIADIGRSLREQNEELKLKLTGQESVSKLIEVERQYQREITDLKREEAQAIKEIEGKEEFTAEDKAAQIGKVKQGYKDLYDEAEKRLGAAKLEAQENVKLNNSLEAQAQLIEDIKNGTGSYKEKVEALTAAYSSGMITQKQWQKNTEDLWMTQRKNNTVLGDSLRQIGQNFSMAIVNGQKLSDVFKNLTKSLMAFAAQRLVFEPIAKLIDNTANRMMGTGRYAPRPTLPGQMAGMSPMSAFNSGFGNSSQTGFGSGAPGLLSQTGSMFKNMFNPSTGTNNTPIPVLEDAYQARRMSGKEWTGEPLQDLEYYLNYMPREEASFRLGVLSMNPFRPTNNSYDFFGGIKNSFNLGGLPSFAFGGTAAAFQPAIVGENGPELIIPSKSMEVIPNRPTEAALQYANNLKWQPGMSTGDWMAKNERAWQLGQERNYFNQSLAPALNQAWRDATIFSAQRSTAEMMRSGRTDHIGFDILNRVQNGGSMMMAMNASFQLPTGDQQMSILQNMQRQGVNISPALLQMAYDNDWSFNQSRGGLYSSGSLGNWMSNALGYKSLGIDGRTPIKTYQDIDAVDNIAYGGDGSQAAVELQREQMKNIMWRQDAISRYNQSMMNRNPLGGYRGASQEYLNNIKTWGKFSNNHKPYADSYGFGVWSGSSTDGLSISNGGWVDSKGGGTSNDWIDDPYDSGDPNPQRFDPTVPSEAYQPKSGSMGDFFKQLNKNPYFDFAAKTMNGLKEAYQSLLSASKSANPSLSRLRDLPGRSLVGDLKESMRSWLPMGQTMGMDIPRSLPNPFPAYPAMMGMASAPKIYSVPSVKNVTNSSGGFGGTLSPGWLDNDTTYSPLFNPRYQAGAASSSFDRWPTNPVAAGMIQARMMPVKRALGGHVASGQSAIVGENGPEMITARQPLNVVPNSALGKPQLTVNITNKVAQTEVVTRRDESGKLLIEFIEAKVQETVSKNSAPVPRKVRR